MLQTARPAVGTGESPTPGLPEKPAVRSMFDRIAPRYDLLNRLLSAGTDVRWRRAAIDLLAPAAGETVLDLCSGTADLLIEALSRDEGVRGVGVDISSAMLGLGLRKLAGRRMSARAALASGDAERLPFGDARFHAAAVAFGIRNVGDMEAAFRETGRVLKPGGRLVVLEFSMPAGVLGRLYRLYFTRVLPTVGGWVSGDARAYSYLPASVERFPAPPALTALMVEAGFPRVRSRALTGGIAHLFLAEKAA
jgi:demethylmenaquinone methyltransferase/2-methoxy-6-polyprenyl-1,4-benzoquinol methylase